MEQSLAPGSQTFEQDLFRLYREGIITLDEALASSDSPTNLSWLINNDSVIGLGKKEKQEPGSPRFAETGDVSASFKEFSLNLDDGQGDRSGHAH